MAGEPDPEKPGTLPSTEGSRPGPEAPRPAVDASELQTIDPAHYARRGEYARGGLGRIVDAHDRRLDRPVALKELLLCDGPSLEARFVREALITARLQHPGIVPVYEAGRWPGGEPFYAMKMVSGRSLRDLIDEARTLEQRLALVPNVLAVADAVAYAHHEGIIHRDLKPSNVVVGAFGETLVVDWGLAKDLSVAEDATELGAYQVVATDLTLTGAVMGTPEYMPPEQARGDPVDERADVYALGAILYHVMAGQAPFTGASSAVVLERVKTEPPPPLEQIQPRAPADLMAIVGKAMARDPQRRYPTAREMTEDLRRFQTGQLVAAHRYSAAQRLRRFLRRHRAAVAAATVGLVAATVLLGLWLRARRTAAEQAVLAQRFGQEVEHIDGGLRQAYLLPEHDIRPAKARVRQRMDWVRTEMARWGAAGLGPGHYALGRGHLSLREYAQARDHLEKALRAGYRPPEGVLALGRAFGGLYVEALEEVRRTPKAQRDGRRAEVEASYRDPALSSLRAASGASDEPVSYGRALIAFYEQRYPDGLADLRQVVTDAPEFYEARTLEGRVGMAEGRDKQERGDYAGALADYERAGLAYALAIEAARSDPEPHTEDCLRRVLVMEIRIRLGQPSRESFETALSACEAAARVDPDDARPYSRMCRALWRRAEDQGATGEDAGETTARAIQMGREAIRRDPRDTAALANLGLALWGQAEGAQSGGRDPLPAYQDAIASFVRASDVRANDVFTLANLSGVQSALANYQLAHGLDPGPALDRAVEAGETAIAVNPSYTAPYSNVGMAHCTRARELVARGQDPSEALERARHSFRRSLEVNPKNAYAYEGLVLADLAAVEYERHQGRDPRPLLRRARDQARRALEINPAFPGMHARIGAAHLLEAEASLDAGADPEPALREGGRELALELKLNAKSVEALREQTRAALVQARWALRRGRSPEDALGAARRSLAAASISAANDADLHLLRAESHRWHAEWLLTQGADPSGEIGRGMAEAERARALNPRLAEAVALEAVLGLVRARSPAAAAVRIESARESAKLFDRAFGVNPLLRRRYESQMRDARQIADRRP